MPTYIYPIMCTKFFLKPLCNCTMVLLNCYVGTYLSKQKRLSVYTGASLVKSSDQDFLWLHLLYHKCLFPDQIFYFAIFRLFLINPSYVSQTLYSLFVLISPILKYFFETSVHCSICCVHSTFTCSSF